MTDEEKNEMRPESDETASSEAPDGYQPESGPKPEPPKRFQENNANLYSNTNETGPQNGSQRPVSQTPQFSGNATMIGIPLTADEAMQFNSGRKYLTAAQIMAIVSLFIGGVLLSSAAVVVAVMGKRKIDAALMGKNVDPMIRTTLDRASKVAIVISGLAVVLNAVSYIVMYPIIMEAMQSGNYSSLLPFAQQPTQPTSPSPGGALFG